ncbi:MAG: GTA-gp10 family protein [Glycocaulis sp.]
MANPQRGEVVLEAGGERHVLCLTLGALAEIEALTGASDMSEIGPKLASLSASGMLDLLSILLRAGGSGADARALSITPAEAARAIARTFEAAAQ